LENNWKTTCALFVLFAATAIIASAQTFTVLANLNGNDGAVSLSPLSQGTDGLLHGTATEGGDYQDCYQYGCGTIFKLDRKGALIDVHPFNGLDGATPAAGLLLGNDGNFYGTTVAGGENKGNVGRGSVFRVTPDGVLTTLYAFCLQANCPEGVVLTD
jgi:uncharacterized repeat protein (TIGR03803 family)